MKIRWNGHACFTITLGDGRVLVTDPYDESVGYKMPEIKADFVTVSHSHHDHNAIEALREAKKVFSSIEPYEEDGLKITSFPSWHDKVCGKKRGSNLLFKIEAEGKTLVHLGDLGHLLDDEQLDFIKNADVLFLPIGGTYTITALEAIEVIKAANAKCVIPMHFKTDALTFPLEEEKEFAKETKAVYLHANECDIENLSGCVIFDYN